MFDVNNRHLLVTIIFLRCKLRHQNCQYFQKYLKSFISKGKSIPL